MKLLWRIRFCLAIMGRTGMGWDLAWDISSHWLDWRKDYSVKQAVAEELSCWSE